MSEEPKRYELARAGALDKVSVDTTNSINRKLPETIQADEKKFGLIIKPTADLDDLKMAGDLFARTTVFNNYSMSVNRFSLGDIINHIALAGQEDVSDVIEKMDLPEKTGLSMRSLYTWAQTASRIRHAHRHNNIVWSMFTLVASYKGVDPAKDPLGHVKFEDARMAILDMIHADPDGISTDWVKERMKQLQQAGNVKPNRPVPKRELFEYGAKLLCISAQFGPADLQKMGKTQTDVTNAIEELQNELINRGIIDPSAPVWPSVSGNLNGGMVEASVEPDEDEEEEQ